ncbi:MAG: dihydroorotase [Deltaproteobacteria bacterium]|nr:dihydroorotase [Deltaproteobacteria bacterium]
MKILIKNGRLVDPSQNLDDNLDVLVDDGVINAIDHDIQSSDADLIDARGMFVTPGLIDMHVHLRDPGQEYKEDITSGTRAAAAGGFTSVACMPNTEPVNDNLATTDYILQKARICGVVNVFPVAAISKGLKGESLTEMGELKEGGCVAFSDDGHWVSNGDLMRRALEYAGLFDVPLISHAENFSISGKGVMNEGFVATELGLRGIPWVAEDAAVYRDVALAEFSGSRLHICHISTRGTVEIIRTAKARGVRVSCDVTPHHLTLTEEAVRGYNTNAKMNPPLRTAEDLEALYQGLRDGTIDAIATDHAPHHRDDKNVEFDRALNGIVGLETALPLVLMLVDKGAFSLNTALAALTTAPARILSLPRGSLKKGGVADITIFDPEKQWQVDSERFLSKSRNTPFEGWTLKGRVSRTLVAGKTVFQDLES